MMSHRRLKDLGRWYSGGTPSRADETAWAGNIPWLSAKDIDRDVLRAPTAFITEQAARKGSRLVPADSVLMIVRGMALAHGLPVVLTTERSAFNQDLRALVPSPKLDARFIHYALRGHRHQFAAHIDRAAHGTARVIDSIYSERIWVPPLDRQGAITRFLDHECARIADLEVWLRSIDLVAAEWLVDKARDVLGIDRHPRAQVRHVATTGTGHTPSRARPDWWAPQDCVIPWFTLADVHQIRTDAVAVVNDTAERISLAGLTNSSAVLHPAGTVLLSRTASVGFSAIMRVDMAVSQDFMTWTCGPRLEPWYLLYTLRAMRPELRRLMYGSTHQTIYMPDLLALRIPLPPPEAQRAAVALLHDLWRTRSAASTVVDAMRTRLAEYRDALITEAVTGQLDVTAVSEQQMDERLHEASERTGA